MSRIDFENIWISYHHTKLSANCPICHTKIDKYQHKYAETAWNRSHIISLSKGGQDILPNVIPLCRSCNSKMKSLDYWEYLVKIGKMDIMTAQMERNIHLHRCHSFISKCQEIGCNNNRLTLHIEFCNRHSKQISMDLD